MNTVYNAGHSSTIITVFCDLEGHTLILRGPSRGPRLLLGVSMVITLSRPLSKEPNIFPVLFLFPLSPVPAMSKERDLIHNRELHTLTFYR